MLKISSEQIRVFQPDAEAAFVRRVSEYLRENHADQPVRLPDEQTTIAQIEDEILHEAVALGIGRGKDYGIFWKSTLLSFVVLLFIAAPNFDEHPKAAEFFSQTEEIEDAQLEQFLETMTDADWELVEENYNPQAWRVTVAR